jgi:ubiquinone/menaquinone biosynthesis C-methylase UbiE
MISSLFRFLTTRFPFLRRSLWGMLYNRFAKQINIPEWKFMNYGYDYNNVDDRPVLTAAEEDERFGFQLYEHMLRQAEIKEGMTLLEVGSGRGGACYTIKNKFPFAQCTGLDYSQPAVDFCNKNFKMEGLTYVQGDAVALPFPDNSFDIVINVESSHAYTSFSGFLSEVKRVLKPGGHFMIADSRLAGEIEKFTQPLKDSGMEILNQTEITPNVVKALEQDSERRSNLIEKHVPAWYKSYFREFAGTLGTNTFNDYKNRRRIYMSAVLKK